MDSDEDEPITETQYSGNIERKKKHIKLNEDLFNDYINKQCNKPTDLLISPFHPFYFITYQNYDFREIFVLILIYHPLRLQN